MRARVLTELRKEGSSQDHETAEERSIKGIVA